MTLLRLRRPYRLPCGRIVPPDVYEQADDPNDRSGRPAIRVRREQFVDEHENPHYRPGAFDVVTIYLDDGDAEPAQEEVRPDALS